ncbi:TPA: helix-turn-helix transcriptional regulator [Staphylococcus aureus]|nr:helix-turn-helix transcriptional regulator [Staphylococcus aureus]
MNYIKHSLKLDEWRKRKGYTQSSFAEKLGISPSTYNIWENNPVWIHRNLVTTVFIGFGVPNGSLNYILSKILVVFLSSSLNFSSNK